MAKLKINNKEKPGRSDVTRSDFLQSGFTLIEVVVSLAIFAFIVGGVTAFAVNTIKAQQKSRAMQEAMDNARYAIDDFAKNIRTSSNVKGDGLGQSLFFVSNLDLAKYCYKFDDDVLKEARIIPNTSGSNDDYNGVKSCSDFSDSDFKPVVGGSANSRISVRGKFQFWPTDIHSDSPKRGYVQINVDLIYNEAGLPEDKAQAHIQSGVSLMDYGLEDFNLEL